ncbi:MAG: hypothetical protein IPO08_21210 [Xanthomonadales bacterium]|nr:hypothetical protein [Xanthomonadales bacterium]
MTHLRLTLDVEIETNAEAARPVAVNALPDTVVIDGIELPTRNGRGRVIHDTPEGIANFCAWFGGSKAVDALGRPLVVYHGTSNDFTAFSDEFVSSRAENEFGKRVLFHAGA